MAKSAVEKALNTYFDENLEWGQLNAATLFDKVYDKAEPEYAAHLFQVAFVYQVGWGAQTAEALVLQRRDVKPTAALMSGASPSFGLVNWVNKLLRPEARSYRRVFGSQALQLSVKPGSQKHRLVLNLQDDSQRGPVFAALIGYLQRKGGKTPHCDLETLAHKDDGTALYALMALIHDIAPRSKRNGLMALLALTLNPKITQVYMRQQLELLLQTKQDYDQELRPIFESFTLPTRVVVRPTVVTVLTQSPLQYAPEADEVSQESGSSVDDASGRGSQHLDEGDDQAADLRAVEAAGSVEDGGGYIDVTAAGTTIETEGVEDEILEAAVSHRVSGDSKENEKQALVLGLARLEAAQEQVAQHLGAATMNRHHSMTIGAETVTVPVDERDAESVAVRQDREDQLRTLETLNQTLVAEIDRLRATIAQLEAQRTMAANANIPCAPPLPGGFSVPLAPPLPGGMMAPPPPPPPLPAMTVISGATSAPALDIAGGLGRLKKAGPMAERTRDSEDGPVLDMNAIKQARVTMSVDPAAIDRARELAAEKKREEEAERRQAEMRAVLTNRRAVPQSTGAAAVASSTVEALDLDAVSRQRSERIQAMQAQRDAEQKERAAQEQASVSQALSSSRRTNAPSASAATQVSTAEPVVDHEEISRQRAERIRAMEEARTRQASERADQQVAAATSILRGGQRATMPILPRPAEVGDTALQSTGPTDAERAERAAKIEQLRLDRQAAFAKSTVQDPELAARLAQKDRFFNAMDDDDATATAVNVPTRAPVRDVLRKPLEEARKGVPGSKQAALLLLRTEQRGLSDAVSVTECANMNASEA